MKIFCKIFAVVMCAALLLTGCQSSAPAVLSDSGFAFTDNLGNEVHPGSPSKVAVLSGSLAEIWLLAGGELAAVTHEAYTDRQFEVPAETVDIGKLTSPSVETMISLGVDFAVLSSELSEHRELSDTLENAGIKTAYIKVDSFPEYLSALKIFTSITGREDLYEKNGAEVEKQVKEVIASVPEGNKPTVLLLRSSSSSVHVKDSDSLTGAMLKDLGCENIADSGIFGDKLSTEIILKSDPDYIFVTYMGSDESKARKMLEDTLMNNPAWSELTAVKNDRLIFLPKELFHYKPNAKWGEAYKQLAEILYG